MGQGYTDLGDFCYQRGDLDGAIKNYVRTRDYCHVNRHIIEMCLNVIKVCCHPPSNSPGRTVVVLKAWVYGAGGGRTEQLGTRKQLRVQGRAHARSEQ
eukprot:44006-Eustigmatos_ZCMA.PRE.1